jgi:hypothetical protein
VTSSPLLPIRSTWIWTLLVVVALPSGRLWQRGEWRASAAADPQLQGASPTVLQRSIGWPPVRAVASLLSWSLTTCRRRTGTSNKRRRSRPWWFGPLLLFHSRPTVVARESGGGRAVCGSLLPGRPWWWGRGEEVGARLRLLLSSSVGAVVSAVAFFSLASSGSSVEPGLLVAAEGVVVWFVPGAAPRRLEAVCFRLPIRAQWV